MPFFYTQAELIGFLGIAITAGGGSGGSTTWGSITGTLSNQTDLQNALNAKQNLVSSPTDNNILLTNGSGQAIDSGISISTSSTANTDNLLMTAKAVQTALSSVSNGLISSATKNLDFVALPNNQYNVDSSSVLIVVTISTPSKTQDGALIMFVDVGGNASNNEIQITNGVDLLGSIRTSYGMILLIYNQTQNKWVIQNQGGYNIDGSNNFNVANIYRFNPSILQHNFSGSAISLQLYNNSQQNILITSSNFVSSRYLILPTGSDLPRGFYFSVIDFSLGRLFPILTGSALNPASSILPNQNIIDKTTLINIIWNGNNWIITTNREVSANGLSTPTTFNLTQSDKRIQIFASDPTPAQTVNLPSTSSFQNGDNFILQNFTTANTITVNYGAGSPATLAPNFSAIFYVKGNSWIMQPFNTFVLNSANIFVGNSSNIATGVEVTGDLTITNTGVTTVGTATPTASTVAKWDANVNFSANNITAGVRRLSNQNLPFELALSDAYQQVCVGITAPIQFTLPDGAGLIDGFGYFISNQTTSITPIAILDSVGTLLTNLSSGQDLKITWDLDNAVWLIDVGFNSRSPLLIPINSNTTLNTTGQIIQADTSTSNVTITLPLLSSFPPGNITTEIKIYLILGTNTLTITTAGNDVMINPTTPGGQTYETSTVGDCMIFRYLPGVTTPVWFREI